MVGRRTSPPKEDRTSSAIVPWMLKAKGVPKGKIKLLLDSKEQIRMAWERDSQGTKGFPLNTSYLFLDLESQLMGTEAAKDSFHTLPESTDAIKRHTSRGGCATST